jgi:hypothetical protein
MRGTVAYLTKREYLTNVISGLVGWGLATLLVYVAGWDEIRWIGIVPIMTGVVVAPRVAKAWIARREKR